MNETKQREPVYSGEATETTKVGTPPEATKTAESSGAEKTGQFPKPTQKTQMAVLPEIPRTRGYATSADFAEFLKPTRRVWLIVAGTSFGLLAVATLVTRASEWARNAREKRQDQAVATVTPDVLLARCGQPAEDVTKDVYPILVRTMSYQSKGNERLVIAFSRTAEQNSDWVLLSMKDESGARNYEGLEGQVAALPCLNSKN